MTWIVRQDLSCYVFTSERIWIVLGRCHMRQFHSDFFCFSFLLLIFFLNGFPNPFIVHSKPSFLLESNLHFSLLVFCFVLASGILTLIFCFFFVFWSNFLRNGFPNSLILRSRSTFLFIQDLSCCVFLVSSSDALFRFIFVHTAKLKKSNFLNDFFLSLTALLAWRHFSFSL